MENRYDKYKDSGIAWIGEIPEHWKIIDLKYLSDIRGRIGFRGYTVSDLVSEGEGAFVIGGKHINQCVLNMEYPDYISWDKYYESPEIMVSKGDIVMAQRGTLGKVAIIEYDINEATINPSLVLIKNIKCQGKFLYYYLNSESTLTLISILNTATAVPMISQNQIENMPIPIPSSIEQQSIATYLDQKCGEIDELITLQEEMITKLQSYKQSVITEAVTKGLDKNVPLKGSGIKWIGEIPEHWEASKTLFSLSMPITDGPHTTPELFETGIPFVSAEAVSFGDGRIDFSRIRGYISENFYQECCKKYVPQVDDIYMIKSGATTGRVAIVDTDVKFTIWSPLAVFRCNKERMLPRFLFYQLQSNGYQKQIELNWSYGTQQNIGMRTLEKLILSVPPLSEQQTIANYLDQKCSEIDELISIKQQKIEKLKDYKKSLIFECVTGKRKV